MKFIQQITELISSKQSNMTDCEKAEKIVYVSCLDEVRYSFVSHLTEALRSIRKVKDVFEDSNDLFSEEAQAMVERARVSVVVLPGDRDPPAACIDKLVKVLECRKKEDQVVVPVLYGVGTSEAVWGLAMQKMSGLSPFHKSRKGCSDSKLVKEIVGDVYEKLFYMEQIGIYPKMVEIESMVCKQPLGIGCVGIWGMPGIGKTTLAKAVFNHLSGEFDSYCFIKDCDSVFHEKGLYRLLEEHFLEEKSGAGRTITKLSLLRKKLNNKRVLVVLDDVRDPLVAESFLRGVDWFGPKSLIIITSREKQVFRLCRVNQIYEVQGLNEKEALQLFMMCASLKDMEAKNLHKLSMEVIGYANGNPLALRIYGRELNGMTELSEMQNTFLKLKRRPPSEIVDLVKSSYETLSDSEKNIFLDIACFFRGENVDYIMQLLEGCDFFPHVGVDVLVDKCLVTISENLLQMHNLIQDVGREIIEERRTRLWKPWSIKYLIEDNEEKTNFMRAQVPRSIKYLIEDDEHGTIYMRAQGTENIEGIFLDTSSLDSGTSSLVLAVNPAAFENMFNLRLLKIYNSNSEINPVFNFPKGLLRSLPKKLRLLHWQNYPLESLPQNFDPMHLVELNMPYSQLQKLWGETKNLEMLRTIRLCHSQQLVDIDDLLQAQNLEVIDLQGCTRLQNFPATGQLLHLRTVNLSGCTEIKVFPEVPPSIEKLYLQGTGITELPLSIVNKPNYRELLDLLKDIPGLSDFSNQNYLESLMKRSSSRQNLGKLICLDLKDCSRLQSLPNMANFECLEVLELSGCSELETIQGLPQNLKELYLAGTPVKEVSQLPQSLELLDAHDCVSLKSITLDSENLPTHYTLPELPTSIFKLTANNCESLESFYGSHSFRYPQATFQFINCFKLSQHARELILQSDCAYAILPGEEIPAHFTHRAVGSVLTVSLPRCSLSKRFSSFRACIIIESRSGSFHFGVVWPFKGGSDKRYYSCLTNTPSTRNHLIVFHCEFSPDKDSNSRAELNYSDVQFEFECLDHKKEMIKIKECGIQLLEEVSPSLDDSRKGFETSQVGFRFSPTDEELINFYLKNKILGSSCLVDDSISEINIYSYEPELLPSLSKIKSNDRVWYFFSPMDYTKRNRTTPSGFWKATGRDRSIKDKGGNGCEIGIVKTLVYHRGRSAMGVKTLWVMHEYKITCLPPGQQRTYVICKIKHKGQARDVLYGDGEVINFPSGSNEVRNLPSGGSDVGNFPSGSKNSSDQMNNNWVGFRFSPTDEELINFYLKNKILGNSWLVDDSISEINFYSYKPESLPALSKMESNDLVWYFFSRNEYTSTKQRVRKRTTPSGFWKRTGDVREIKDKGGNGCEIGSVKTLVYHKGKGPNKIKSPWVMHEYHTTCLPLEQHAYVICKIMYKGEYFPSGGNEVGSIPSAVYEVGNFSSAEHPTVTEMDKRQQKLLSVQTPVADSNTQRAADFAEIYKLPHHSIKPSGLAC